MLFYTQDGEDNCTGPDLLFYYKKILACLLANQYTPLGIINGVKAIVYGVILYRNSKSI